MSILAIIPARANSKRLPNKNILKLAGKPLIKWTIDSALQCNDISKVMVSTDSPKIAELATQFGADVPYLRCAELSGDTASSYDVVINAISLYRKRDANAVVSVVECEHSPLWCNTLPDSLRMDNFINDEIKKTRSQDLPKYYQINGAIYLIKTESLLREKTFIPKKTFALIMSKKNSVDIDDYYDFLRAEVFCNEDKRSFL